MSIKILDFPRQTASIFSPAKIWNNIIYRYFASTSEKPHIFVIGAPRSGTTLMFSILLAHSEISAIDSETFLLVPRDIFNLNNYSRLEKFGFPNSRITQELLQKSNDLVHLYDNIADFILQRDGGTRFLEKTPFHVFYLSYLVKHFPQAKFINMIRDGRDGYVSNNRLPQEFHLDAADFAKLWCKSIRSRNQLKNDPQILDVYYEELTTYPQKVTAQIMNFLGEDFLERQIIPDGYARANIFKGMSGHERLSKPISPNSIGQWKTKMSLEEINIFNRIAKAELQNHKYEII